MKEYRVTVNTTIGHHTFDWTENEGDARKLFEAVSSGVGHEARVIADSPINGTSIAFNMKYVVSACLESRERERTGLTP